MYCLEEHKSGLKDRQNDQHRERQMRKLTSVRGLEIIAQGARQFMAMGFEDSRGNPNCPFNQVSQAVETKLWMKGYTEARFKWFKPFEDRKRKFVRPVNTKPLVKKFGAKR